MDNIFDIGYDVMETVMYSHDFDEFCEAVDELNKLTSPIVFTEEVIDHNVNLIRRVHDSVVSGADYASSAAGAYFNIVDANGTLLKNTWDLIMKGISLISRIIKFILNKIAYIPKFIGKVLGKIGQIPPNLINKIKGNIILYIHVSDINLLYEHSLLKNVSDLLKLAETLSRGDSWGRWLLHHRRLDKESIIPVNDRKICKQMMGIYIKIKTVEFRKSPVEMSKGSNKDLYFGNSKSISFKDLDGNQHQCTYYEALQIIIKDIESQQEKLSAIDEALCKKLNVTKLNNSYNDLDPVTRAFVSESIGVVSKTVSILGNLTKSIISDMRVIDSNVDKILKANGVRVNNNSVKNAEKTAKAVNKPPKGNK